MSVLIEAISVVFRNEIANSLIRGGIETIQQSPPNHTFRTDGKISSVSFMAHRDAETFINNLKQVGFKFLVGNASVDIAIIDQKKGYLTECEWLELDTDERGVKFCWLLGSEPLEMATPEGWEFEKSLYVSGVFNTDEETSEN
jgi:hypothetical protein